MSFRSWHEAVMDLLLSTTALVVCLVALVVMARSCERRAEPKRCGLCGAPLEPWEHGR